MKKFLMTVVALMGATTLFAQTDVVATFQQGVGNAKAGNFTDAIAQFQSVIDAGWDMVVHQTSTENGERPGITYFAFWRKYKINYIHYL